MLTEKRCFKCSTIKPLTEFYPHKQMPDGHLNKCKACAKTDSKNHYADKSSDADFIESQRTRGRDKYRRLYAGIGKANIEASNRWRANYPEKYKAISVSGKLKKPSEDVERHHWSYNENHRLDVLWLTKKQHNKAHRFLVYDTAKMMYRRSDNNKLLDTKKDHEYYIKYCIITKPD